MKCKSSLCHAGDLGDRAGTGQHARESVDVHPPAVARSRTLARAEAVECLQSAGHPKTVVVVVVAAAADSVSSPSCDRVGCCLDPPARGMKGNVSSRGLARSSGAYRRGAPHCRRRRRGWCTTRLACAPKLMLRCIATVRTADGVGHLFCFLTWQSAQLLLVPQIPHRWRECGLKSLLILWCLDSGCSIEAKPCTGPALDPPVLPSVPAICTILKWLGVYLMPIHEPTQKPPSTIPDTPGSATDKTRVMKQVLSARGVPPHAGRPRVEGGGG